MERKTQPDSGLDLRTCKSVFEEVAVSSLSSGKPNHTPYTIQGYLAHKKQPPPHKGHLGALYIVLLEGPREALFLTSEVPLYAQNPHLTRSGGWNVPQEGLITFRGAHNQSG